VSADDEKCVTGEDRTFFDVLMGKRGVKERGRVREKESDRERKRERQRERERVEIATCVERERERYFWCSRG